MIPYRIELNALHDYVPGKSIEEIREHYGLQQVTKLASNENPFGPSPLAISAVQQALTELHLYPRGECPRLRSSLATHFGIAEDQLVLGNGSDEILAFIAQAYLGKGDEALSCEPTFSIYESATRLMGADYRSIPLADWGFDLQGLAAAITARVRVIFLCNPNNPTGTWFGSDAFHAFMAKVPANVLVVVDQAYAEFADDNSYPQLVQELKRYSNLVLTRTFSKVWGLAGMRIGYAMGAPEVISKFWKVKPPFDVNLPAQYAAVAALGDQAYLAKTLANNAAGKQQLREGLQGLALQILPTQANFMAVEFGDKCMDLVLWLEKNGMIVRGLKNFGLTRWLRVTVGLPAENALFLDLVRKAKQEGVLG